MKGSETHAMKGRKHKLRKGRNTGYERTETQAIKGKKHRH
jgi:hypothetical protein